MNDRPETNQSGRPAQKAVLPVTRHWTLRAMVALAVLIFIATAIYTWLFPFPFRTAAEQSDAAILISWLSQFVIAGAVLQIALAFLIFEKGPLVEIRFRLCVFLATVALLFVVCTTFALSYSGCSLTHFFEEMVAFHSVARLFLLIVAPLLIGLCVHSALYAGLEMNRLPCSPVNLVVVHTVIIMMAIGASCVSVPLIWCYRAGEQAVEDMEKVSFDYWVRTDRETLRRVADCPGDYHFLLLRANYLQDAGRTREAAAMFRQVCEATNVPPHIREAIEAHLTATNSAGGR